MTSHHVDLTPLVGPKGDELLMWRTPKASAAVLVGITAVFITFSVLQVSLGYFLCCAAMTAVAAFALWAFAAPFVGRKTPEAVLPKEMFEGLTEAQATALAKKGLFALNQALLALGKVASGNHRLLSAKVFAGLFLASFLIKSGSVLLLVFVIVLLAFSLPKVYELRKDDVDKALDAAATKGKEIYAKLDEAVFKKIPKGSKPKAT